MASSDRGYVTWHRKWQRTKVREAEIGCLFDEIQNLVEPIERLDTESLGRAAAKPWMVKRCGRSHAFDSPLSGEYMGEQHCCKRGVRAGPQRSTDSVALAVRTARPDGEQMRIDGKCHCGNIAFVLDWPGELSEIAARECGCSFCVKHGGVWTSNREARLSVSLHSPSLVSKYAFETRTATFHVCTRCGAVPLVTSVIAKRLYAVVNVNTFEGMGSLHVTRQPVSFDGEEPQSRVARRERNWIADVRIAEGPV